MIISIAITILLAAIAQGCAKPPDVSKSIENAAALAQYERLLDDCKKKGKASRDYEVYERCADAVDADLCKHNMALCKEAAP